MSDPQNKIVHIFPNGDVNWRALLAQIAEREGVEAVVMAVKIDGRWSTCWGSGEAKLDLGSLSMAALKILRDVTVTLHD